MTRSAFLRGVAVAFPPTVRTNEELIRDYPELYAEANEQALCRLFGSDPPENAFDRAMQPYLEDPFRGTVERRVLGEGEGTIDLEVRAAKSIMAAHDVSPESIGALISSSFLPDHIGIGNAVYVSDKLGLLHESWNLETACSGSMLALKTACGLVRAGEHDRMLVTASCSYSRPAVDGETLSWFLGDGAAAFLVDAEPSGAAYLGGYAAHTADTCGTWFYALEQDGGQPRISMRANRGTGRAMSRAAGPTLRRCCEAAVNRAGVQLRDIAFFAINTPTAWFADFAAAELGFRRSQTISTYPRFGNIGPILMPANLVAAANGRRLASGDLVLLFSIGSVSSASAMVFRWDERVSALGMPAPA